MAPDGWCELKRLYVAPRARGAGLGRKLLDVILAEARRIGYREMRLDTLPTMAEAVALYRSAWFVPVEPYYDTPVAGTGFLGRRLGWGRTPPPPNPPPPLCGQRRGALS